MAVKMERECQQTSCEKLLASLFESLKMMSEDIAAAFPVIVV